MSCDPIRARSARCREVEVRGFDIAQPTTDALKAELVSLWNEHAILLFRGQDSGQITEAAGGHVPLLFRRAGEHEQLRSLRRARS